ncbi:MAG: hypothetical protein ACTXOO_00775 [Sodalis sp. (in: enterobacteria)]
MQYSIAPWRDQFICAASCVQARAFGDTQAAREHAPQRNKLKKATKAIIKTTKRMDALEVSELLPRMGALTRSESQVFEIFRAVGNVVLT